MFLTTNRVRDFDDAIQSRTTLAVRYDPLNLVTRKQVWVSFLKKAATLNGAAEFDQKELDRLAGKDLNGRQVRAQSSNRSNRSLLTVGPSQIKNMAAAAYALATYQNTKVSMSHLELVTSLSEEFEHDFGGAGKASNNTYL